MTLRGLSLGRFSHFFRRVGFCTSLMALVVGCNPSGNSPEVSESSTQSPLPGIFIVDGLPLFLGPSTVYQGVWLSETEGSQFFENENVIRDHYDEIYFDTWLSMRFRDPDFPPAAPITNYRSNYGPSSATFIWVKFRGRRNITPGPFGFGHLGTSRNYVLVEKVISARPLKR